MKNNLSRILWGIVLIIIGLIWGLKALDILDFNIFFDGWWCFLIIIPCLIGLITEDDKKGNLIGLIIGILLFLCCIHLIDFDIIWKLFLPIVIVVIGLSMIFGNQRKELVKEKVSKVNEDEAETIVATFGETNVDKENEKFECGILEAIFGSVKLDLRKSKLKDEAMIKTSSIFGSIEILVPKDVNVKVKSTAIFGGVDNHTKKDDENKKTIYVDAFILFGGVDIK